MNERERLTVRFEEHKPRLRAVAYRMLGSLAEADDVLQEAWLRICDWDTGGVEDLQAWLTTVVGRLCLNVLRSRRMRLQELSEFRVPDPVVSFQESDGPERDVLLADSVGLALLVVLDALEPAERLAFVLHDMFSVPFSEIATALGRSESATQQLASRARRRVHNVPEPERDLTRQRSLVAAFFAAARDGDFDSLLRVLHPEVVLRIDGGKLRHDASLFLRGAEAVSKHTRMYASLHPHVIPAFVNGAAGALVVPHGKPFAVMGFTISHGGITEIDVLLDPERLTRLGLIIPP